ncbi:MAG: FG-GAP-like repeat-containing protein [Thermodesulfobacteriota bacterium]
MVYRKIVLACLFVLLLPASGWTKTVKVAVLPWRVNSAGNMDFLSDAMSDMLATRLGSNKDVEVARPDLVRSALGASAGAVTDGAAIEAGKKLAADYVLYGSITVLGSAISLDAKLVSVADGKISPVYSKAEGLDAVVGMADRLSADVLALSGAVEAPVRLQSAAPAIPSGAVDVTTGVVGAGVTGAAGAVGVAGAPAGAKAGQPEGFIIKSKAGPSPVTWKSAPMDGMYSAMAAADLDKDGKKELFIISGTTLVVAVPNGSGLDVVKKFDTSTGYTNVAVCALDTDGDGSTEVYLSRLYNNRPSTAVIEYSGGEYRQTVEDVGWLVRVISPGKGGPVLIGQAFTEPTGFAGSLKRLEKQGQDVVVKGAFEYSLPYGVDLYRFDIFDLTGDGVDDLVAVNDRNYLRVYEKGEKGGWKKQWGSTDFYGGTLNLVSFYVENPSAEPVEPVAVEGGFFHADTDGDGKAELIIRKNIPGGLGRWAERPSSFKGAEVYSLSWDPSGASMLKENWKTRKVDGYMADFILDDLDGDGTGEITMLVVEGTGNLLGRPKTYVLSYRVSI